MSEYKGYHPVGSSVVSRFCGVKTMPIIIKNLSKSYRNRPVLDSLSLTINDGAFACITGKSGVGKTTLLNILAGTTPPDSGEITGLYAFEKISVVFQEDRLLPWFDAIKNVTFVMDKNRRSRAEYEKTARRILNELNLTDGDIGKNITELSGGMRRRVEIARALARDFDLLLLDEPFKGLDAETKFMVMDRVLSSCDKKTVVMVTHDFDEIQYIKNKVPVEIIEL